MKLFKLFAAAALTMSVASNSLAAPTITGDPIIVKHIGSMDWPGDKNGVVIPFLTQGDANA